MLSERSRLHAILQRHGLRPAKGLGQHFLVDEEILRAIAHATGAQPGDSIVEIGAGVGNLTTLLTLSGAHVTAIELDTKFQTLHREIQVTDPQFAERLSFLYQDALDFDYCGAAQKARSEGRRFLIAGNIPYQITSPLIMGILDAGVEFETMTFLMQREVAERLSAKPGTRKNGSITIKVQYDCVVEPVSDVPASAFLPPPEVNSQVVQFRLHPHRRSTEDTPVARERRQTERDALIRLVDAAFIHRRKMLANSVASVGLGYSKEQLEQALETIGLPQTARAEQLGVPEFLALLAALQAH